MAGVLPASSPAANDPPEKKAEHRDGPPDATARPAGPTPGRTESTPPNGSGKPPEKCETVHQTVEQQTTTVEEVTVTAVQEVRALEVSHALHEVPGLWTFEELVHHTKGRPRVISVPACNDPRYPLPSYSWVGVQPLLSYRTSRDTLRLQRFECEIEVDADWRPADSLFTLVAGSTRFQVALERWDHPGIVFTEDPTGRASHPVAVGILRGVSSQKSRLRCVLSFAFPEAASGGAPELRPGDAIYLSADPASSAPPGQALPHFLLVDRRADATSTLLLVEKTGAIAGMVPALNELELAASCTVLHLIPR